MHLSVSEKISEASKGRKKKGEVVFVWHGIMALATFRIASHRGFLYFERGIYPIHTHHTHRLPTYLF